MEFVSKFFDELNTTELYEILRARVEIFVVEQECVYQDLDGRDYNSLHIFSINGGRVAAYLRAFEKEKGVVQMGRVLTIEHGKGLGGKLLREGIAEIKKKLSPVKIYIEAQCYATGYYAREGFEICTKEFLEDGIPHVGMELKI